VQEIRHLARRIVGVGRLRAVRQRDSASHVFWKLGVSSLYQLNILVGLDKMD
jgi:hypothetical protein